MNNYEVPNRAGSGIFLNLMTFSNIHFKLALPITAPMAVSGKNGIIGDSAGY
jgi:hypothetical protein